MNNSKNLVAEVQKALNKRQNGTLLLVKILNADELNILIADKISQIFKKFFLLVQEVCSNFSDVQVIRSHKETKVCIILPSELKNTEQLAYSIYSQTQLCVDLELPESYMKCAVGSIKFSSVNNFSASRLISLINYGMSNSQDQSYYYSYDDSPIDIEKIRTDNKNLNLLRSCLLQKRVKFVYQPIVDRKTGNISYYECLLRILDDNNNYISVGCMIKEAESKGLISIVDFTVVEMAIKELASDKNLSLSVNISNIGVLNKRLLQRIETLLKKYQVAERLIIEITETSLNQDFIRTKKFINNLHKYGCKFALDDFGSGFTSFKQLLNLPIDIIKIDGSYIRDILDNNHSKFFVEALIKLAEDLGVKTVAEFVENGEIAKFLIDIKIDGMQGNFFLPASESRVD
jgi:c-di-GMP phosphodiesterase